MQRYSPFPQFTLQDTYGRQWHSSTTAEKNLVLNFWSAECPWSQKVDLLLQPHLKVWGDRVLHAAALEQHLPLVLLDEQQTLANQLEALTTPHFFVFDSEGLLQYQGGFDDTSFRIHTATRQYLVEGREPEVKEAPSFGCTIVKYS